MLNIHCYSKPKGALNLHLLTVYVELTFKLLASDSDNQLVVSQNLYI